MQAEPILLTLKASVLGNVLTMFDPDLPSLREAEIQIAKLDKMAREFQRRFPWEAIPQGPEKKAKKAKGEQRQRLARQNKHVDKMIRKLFEEHVAQVSNAKPGDVKRIRGQLQKLVEGANRKIYAKLDQQVLEKSKGRFGLGRLLKS